MALEVKNGRFQIWARDLVEIFSQAILLLGGCVDDLPLILVVGCW